MQTVEQIEHMLRDRAEVYPGHPAVPFLRAVAEAFVEYAQEQVAAERDACARIASGMDVCADCDDRGMQDPETGEIPCSAESRGEVCVCVERSDLAHKIATKIRARSA